MEIFTDMGVTDLDSADNFDLNQVQIVGSLFFKNLSAYKQSVVGEDFRGVTRSIQLHTARASFSLVIVPIKWYGVGEDICGVTEEHSTTYPKGPHSL